MERKRLDAPAGFSGVFQTPPLVVPVDTAYLRLQVRMNGVATFKVGRAEIRKV